MENNYGIAPEIHIWTVNLSYFSHFKKTTEIQKRCFLTGHL